MIIDGVRAAEIKNTSMFKTDITKMGFTHNFHKDTMSDFFQSNVPLTAADIAKRAVKWSTTYIAAVAGKKLSVGQ